MINEIINYEFFWFVLGGILLYFGYKLMFHKNKDLERLKREYSDLVNSEKYKVKGKV